METLTSSYHFQNCWFVGWINQHCTTNWWILAERIAVMKMTNGTKDRTWPREWGSCLGRPVCITELIPWSVQRVSVVYIYIHTNCWYTYPPEKYESQIGSSSQLFRKIKTCSKPPTSMCVCLYSHRYVWWNPCCCLRQRLVTWSLAPATMPSKRIRTSAKDQLDSPVAMEKNTHQSSPWDRKLRSHHCKTLICISYAY